MFEIHKKHLMRNLFVFFLTLTLFACQQKNEKSSLEQDTIPIVVPDKAKELELTPQQTFLRDNGFPIDADFTTDQFEDFKGLIESGLFKKTSFCDVYFTALNLEGKELKAYLKPYQKVQYFETALFMYGPRVCKKASPAAPVFKSSNASICLVSEDFIKQDLRYPDEADFSSFDCTSEQNPDQSYTVLRKVTGKNAYGVRMSYVYKVRFGYLGGEEYDMKNWKLVSIQSQKYE